MVRNIDMCLPLMADEITPGYVDLWEGNDNFIRYWYSDECKLWCREDPRTPNFYWVVNGCWMGYREGDNFIIPGGNNVDELEDFLYGHRHPRITTITDWVRQNKCGYERG